MHSFFRHFFLIFFYRIKVVIIMKLKNFIPFLFSVVVGVSFAFFMFFQYEEGEPLQVVSKETEKTETVYFLQQGVYSSKESLKTNTSDLTDYIYEEKDGKYYVYIGITKKEENAEKIKGYYEKKGYILYQKEISVKGTNFLNSLDEYDALLLKSEEDKTIQTICKQVLNQYKELVLDVKNEGTSKE